MTLILDTFNGAAPDRTWTAIKDTAVTLTTVGGRGTTDAGFSTAVHRPDGDTGSNDMFAEIDLPAAFGDGDRTAGVMTRVGTGATATGYLASVNDQGDRVEITRVVGNEFIALTGFEFTPVDTPTRLRLESEGDTHRLYLGTWSDEASKPAPITAIVDDAIPAGSRAAISTYNSGTTIRFDNFRAGSLADLASGSGGTPPAVATSAARVGPTVAAAQTTPAFNAPAGSVIVVAPAVDSTGGSNPALTITNSGAALTWVPIVRRGSEEVADGARPGTVAAFYAIVAAVRNGITVTATSSISGRNTTLKTYVVTGVDTADVLGAVLEGSDPVGTNVLVTDPLVTESGSSLVFFVANESESGPGLPTSPNATIDAYSSAGNHSGASGYRTSGAAGTSMTFTLDAAGVGTGISWNWVAFEIRSVAAATPHSRTVTDRVGLLDPSTRTAPTARSAVDPVGTLDTPARAGTVARSSVDPVGVPDTAVAALSAALSATITDGVGMLDVAASVVSITYNATITDPIGTTDTAARTASLTQVRVEQLDVDDTLARAAGIGALIVDQVAAGDAAASTSGRSVEQLDPVGVLDERQQAGTANRSTVDPASVGDTVTAAQDHRRAIVDLAGMADTAAPATATAQAITDALGVLDVAARAGTTDRAVVEQVGAGDALIVEPAFVIERVVTDPVAALDLVDVAPAVVHQRTTVDAVTALDQAAGSSSTARTAVDQLDTADQTERAEGFGAELVDALAVADAPSTRREIVVEVFDVITAADTAVPARAVKATVLEQVGILDRALPAQMWMQELDDPVATVDTAVRGQAAVRSLLHTLGVTSTALRVGDLAREQASAVTSADLLDGAQDLRDVFREQLGVIDEHTSASTAAREPAELLGLLDLAELIGGSPVVLIPGQHTASATTSRLEAT